MLTWTVFLMLLASRNQPESYYLRTIRAGGLAIEEMTPYIVTPHAGETLVDGVPDT